MTCMMTSPNSLQMFCVSFLMRASQSSNVSSMVFGRRLSLVCLRSHGHSTRSLSSTSSNRPNASNFSSLECTFYWLFINIVYRNIIYTTTTSFRGAGRNLGALFMLNDMRWGLFLACKYNTFSNTDQRNLTKYGKREKSAIKIWHVVRTIITINKRHGAWCKCPVPFAKSRIIDYLTTIFFLSEMMIPLPVILLSLRPCRS